MKVYGSIRLKTLVFIDSTCPAPYSGDTLRTEGMGGSEASLVRIAEGLAPFYNVVVVQHNRKIVDTVEGVVYQNTVPPTADFVVVLRQQALVPAARRAFPDAKLFLWLTDLPQTTLMYGAQALADNKVTLIGVSSFHENGIRDMVIRGKPSGVLKTMHIYNPIDDSLVPDDTPVMHRKLVFFSAPVKGLDATLQQFGSIMNSEGPLSNLELYVSNPGYMPDKNTAGLKNVVNLGSLPHHEIMKHVRSALCVFTCNKVFPETFGLVFAEAQAVGTPFIAHPLGALREISSHPHQLIDTTDIRKVSETLTKWIKDRPIVALNAKFRLRKVLLEWHNILK